ncbi:MAG: rod shape-determining protein MreC [Alphaproteobacteria bacterium]|nr:rod shape-determining protein MreC [Alphaproteobacteria bacterium]
MPVRPRHNGWVSATAVSWRQNLQRFSFVFFLCLALGLLFLGRSKPVVVAHMRATIVDSLAPVLDVVSRPMSVVDGGLRRATDYVRLQSENEKLRAENARMLQWQNTALALGNENKELRGLLHYKAEPALAYISARVIADAGGPFVHSLVVTAGKLDGVREGMAAMTGEGLVGRVVEVGDWSSRILLITDLNSRIPVTVAGSGDHAILAGDNAPKPRLLYLPQDALLKAGEPILTSGHGGIFPPNLPVGVITSASRGTYEVTPLAHLGRINQVRLIDFNLAGGALNPIAAKIEADSRKR